MENKKEEPTVDNTVEKIKVKKPKAKKFATPKDNVTKVNIKDKSEEKKEDVTKVDLTKEQEPKENEVKKDNTNDEGVVAESKDAESTQEQEKIQSEEKTQQTPVLEEVTEDSTEQEVAKVEEKVEEAIAEAEATGKPLPENIQKLIDFMEETGGDLNDYVKLNQDYSKVDDNTILKEYYKKTKPHLNNEEINFLMEDTFSYDEEVDEEIEIKRKKLALKEQVANAKRHLDGQKSKYYKDIKAGNKLTTEQQKAVNFFNRYNKESKANQEIAKTNSDIFTQKTNQVFNSEFKGFEYNVGEKKYRFNVNNAEEIKETQSNLNNFTKKFLDKKMALTDAMGYHKSLYTAMNADAIAKHFYEQGKADAIKNSIAKSKNVDMNPRQSHGVVEAGGIKVRVLGDNSSDFKFKIKNKNK
jgi:hypothetical protein|tara:strand:- start:914 stop:2149 length:1236 start_codon:yes stop_codon:yes gene_type:complete